MEQIIKSPFVWGLTLGLICTIIVWIQNFLRRKELKKKINDLETHLNTQMTITTRGHSELLKELEACKSRNENLRISIKTWQQKPGRADLRALHVYDRGIRLMVEKAPGFAPVWETVLKEAEEEFLQTETGIKSLITKVFRPTQKPAQLPANKSIDDLN